MDNSFNVAENGLVEKVPKSSLTNLIFDEELNYLNKTLKIIDSRYIKMQKEVETIEKAYQDGMKEASEIAHLDSRMEFIKELNRMMKERGYKFKKNESKILRSSKLVPYFARLDFLVGGSNKQNISNNRYLSTLKPTSFYIGKHANYDDSRKLLTVDWRAPLASLYYNYSEPAKNAKYVFEREHTYQPWIKEVKTVEGDLLLRRNFDIENSHLLSVYDNSLKIDLLTRSLNKKKGGVLEDIVSTIQDVQNQIIRENPDHICVVQGTAGSGKTTIAMHRISYLFYNYKDKIKETNTLLLTTSNVLVNYMSKTLPELEVFDITQDTLAGLIRKLLIKGEVNLSEYKIHEEKADNSALLNTKEFINEFDYAIDNFTDEIKSKIINHKYYKELDIQRLVNRIENKQIFEFIRNILEYLDDYHTDVKVLIKDGRYTLEYLNAFITDFVKFLQDVINKFDYARFVREFYSEKSILNRIKDHTLYLDDLCLIFYLYTRLNGTLSEIGSFKQIIVDEGQDLGLLNYNVIKTLSNQKGLTIMGDLNQAISDNGTIKDWKDLENIFESTIKYYNIEYSYRTTRQIAMFAGSILQHFKDFKYLPKPFDRDGESVNFINFDSKLELIANIGQKVILDRKNGNLKSIGIIEPDLIDIENTFNTLKRMIPEIVLVDDKFDTFESDKVYLIPENLVKGLEFSTVFIIDPNENLFKFSKDSARRLFVSCTRAINSLNIYYFSTLSRMLTGR